MIFFKKSPTTNHQPPATLLVGLGNPGPQYAGNRHNIGFMAIDRIAADYNFSKGKKTFGGDLLEGKIPLPLEGGGLRRGSGSDKADPHPASPLQGEVKVLLLKPLTFMNLSGEAVGKAIRFYKIPPEKVIVLHDELDLPLSKLRVKKGGGHGGHNGLKSIDAHIGKEYWRVRLGIDHPGDKERVTQHVLSDFSKAEQKAVDAQLAEVSRHIALLLQGDEAAFMNKLTIATKDEK